MMIRPSEHESRKGKYINDAERAIIWTLLQEGKKVREIARSLDRSPSTISRELKRGRCRQVQSDDYGQRYVYVYSDEASSIKARKDQSRRCAKPKLIDDKMGVAELERLIKKEDYSPAAALHIAKEQGLLKVTICVGTLYNYIKRGLLDITAMDMPYNKTGYAERAQIKRSSQRHLFLRMHGMSIECRPPTIENRRQFGHWEGDLVVGPQGTRSCIFTLTERLTRFEIAVLVANRKCATIADALDKVEKAFDALFRPVFLSITFDNGIEFLDYELLTREESRGVARFQIFYAHPYSSFERGANENANRMLRRKFPKGTNFDNVDQEAVTRAAAWLNDYPRSVGSGVPYRAANAFRAELANLHVAA